MARPIPLRPTVDCSDRPDVTKQSFIPECDINNIINKYDTQGVLTHIARGTPQYADVSAMGSYREALDRVNTVNEVFAGLPAEIRAEFNHDPAVYLDYVSTHSPEEVAEAIDGVLSPEEPSEAPSPPPAAPQASETPPNV